MGEDEVSFKEQRVRSLTALYYSKPEIQKALFDFSQNREICPRYFEGFGRRPDSFQYQGDIFELVKKGATSFHCSEELWKDVLKVQTGMSQEQLNQLRLGWDLLIDIDSKYIDYSKIMAKIIIKMLNFHGVENVGCKFSGSKGFHLIIPWQAFPEEINGVRTSDMFPEWARIITQYIIHTIKKELVERISELERPSKYVKDYQASKEVMPDLVLVSPRHLFRMPYSLHEKTALASVVLNKTELENFELKDAEPLKAVVKNFIPQAKKGEASELLMQALDWHESASKKFAEPEKKSLDYKPIQLSNLSQANFPACINNILNGLADGKKRALFVLINTFRSVGMEKEELEKRISYWNAKNKPPLKEGYIITQLAWAYKRKPFMPSNCREFYQNIGVCAPDNFCNQIKNPVNYIIRKTLQPNQQNRNKGNKK